MSRKVPLGLQLDKAGMKQLTALAKEKKMSRSELLNNAVVLCVDHPQLFSKIVQALIDQEESQKAAVAAKKTNTSALVDVDYIEKLDKMAARMIMSRNTLLNIITGGINLRVI